MKFLQKILLIVSGISLLILIALFFRYYNLNWWKQYEQVNVLPSSQYSLPSTTAPQSAETDENDNVNIPTFTEKNEEVKKVLSISDKRKSYQDGEITLIIPSIQLNETVLNGTDAKTLNRGAGLYEYAQLPNEKNANVSIAAHRNKSSGGVIREWFFYYIDRLQNGNHLYLIFKDKIYEYVYLHTSVVTPDDWSSIYPQGYGCITLTSCEPIGIASHRIVVQGKLKTTYTYSDEFQFKD